LLGQAIINTATYTSTNFGFGHSSAGFTVGNQANLIVGDNKIYLPIITKKTGSEPEK